MKKHGDPKQMHRFKSFIRESNDYKSLLEDGEKTSLEFWHVM